MKIQELAIIFVIIILPISLLLSEYTQFQIQTLKTQTEYDFKLTAATYDAIKTFQLNSTNSTESALVNAEMRDLTASVNSFKTSLMSTFKLNGYTEEELNSYIPALVYTLYDGFYIYSPYQNENHRYEITSEDFITGEKVVDESSPIDGNGEKLYGIKPYISYSCRYKRGNADVVITYSLDNYITVQGMIGDEYVNKGGYLIEIDETGTQGYGVYYKKNDDDTEVVRYNGETILTEQLTEHLPLKPDVLDEDERYTYAKINGIKYYIVPQYYPVKDASGAIIGLQDCIIYLFNGDPIIQAKESDGDRYTNLRDWILKNDAAKQYYIDAYKFTKWFQSYQDLRNLRYEDAYDEIINTDPNDAITDGQIDIGQLWPGNNDRIFTFKNSNPNIKSIETEFSTFNQHRLAIIRKKIETNLAIAISNYNDYSNVSNVFQMPQLKETEWDNITHNISLISFLQGLPIGGKIYNGYSIVTNSESDKVVFEENIYFLASLGLTQKEYHRVGDQDLETMLKELNADKYAETPHGEMSNGKITSSGRLNLDFERAKVLIGDEMKYYYPLGEYNASYNSIVTQHRVTLYDDIYEYLEEQSNSELARAFYTALGRERAGNYISMDDIIKIPGESEEAEEPEETSPEGGGFKEDSFVITYNMNYVGADPLTVSQTLSNKYAISLYNPDSEVLGNTKRVGYAFWGWALKSDASEPLYEKESPAFNMYTPIDYQYFYALWKKAYTLTYHENAGGEIVNNMPNPATHTWTEGEDVTISKKEPVRVGYYFRGWNTDPKATIGNSAYAPKKILATPKVDIELYAIWEKKNTVTLAFDANGGIINENGVVKDKTYITKYEDEDIYVPEDLIVTRDGYNFKGWSTSPDSKKVEILPGQKYIDKVNKDFYAVWEAQEYTLTYDANGGEGAPESQKISSGQKITLSDKVPTKDGYDFLGWSTSSEAEAAEYLSSGEYIADINLDKNITLYAVWKAQEYTLTYDANGGDQSSVKPSEQKWKYGEDITLSKTKPTRENHIFVGWSTDKNATEKQYSHGDKIEKPKEDITLYAVWDVIWAAIYYEANFEPYMWKMQAVPQGTNAILLDNMYEREGYKFLGWDEDSKAKIPTYQPGDEYENVKGSIDLYAIWEEDSDIYTLTYDANGGLISTVPEPQTWKDGEDLVLNDKKPTRLYHTFIGWSTDPNATEKEYSPSDKIEKPVGDMTLYAVWKAEEVLISYYAKTNPEWVVNEGAKKGQEIVIKDIFRTKEGYTFKGWTRTDGSTVVEYKPGDKYKAIIPFTNFYAIWEKDACIVTYDANGGIGAPEQQSKVKGEDLTLSSIIPTREGYTFLGWYTEEYKEEPLEFYAKNYPDIVEVYGSEPSSLYKHWIEYGKDEGRTIAQYTPGAKYTEDANITLYAGWAEIVYVVKLDTYGGKFLVNGEEHDVLKQMKTRGNEMQIKKYVPTREGYTFLGWYTEKYKDNPIDYYVEMNPDLVGNWNQSYYYHWILNGRYEGRKIAPYQPKEMYSDDKDITLYAGWIESAYLITLNANGGLFDTNEMVYKHIKEYGDELTLHSGIPTREGYIFLGWYKEEYKDNPLGFYAENNKDVVDVYGSDPKALYQHWIDWGKAEGRKMAPYQPGEKYKSEHDQILYAGWLEK